MNKPLQNAIIYLSLLFCFFGCGSEATIFYVAKDGSVDNPGTIDAPFSKLEDARNAIRKLKNSKGLPGGGLQVLIRSGVYQLSETFTLSEEDGGSLESPIRWAAFPGEKVVITGGINFDSFSTISDAAALERVQPEARNQIQQIDLSSYKIEDYGSIDPTSGNKAELYVNGAFMQLARYPNSDWLKIASVPQFGAKEYVKERERMRYGVSVGRHFGRFTYDTDRPDSWAEDDHIWMQGYWVWDWKDEYQRIDRIDKVKKEIYPAEPYHSYGYHQHQRFYFLNILEELDQEGEWYLDRAKDLLFFWPPSGESDQDVWLSILSTPLVHLEGVSHLSLEDIDFRYSRAEGVVIVGGSDVKVAGCTFSNLGKHGVIIDGGNNHEVIGCDMYQMAMGAIKMEGGDRSSLTPGNHQSINNHIHHFSQRVKTYQPAISTRGVGNIISHNLIHEAPHMAIGFSGNDHLIEYNEVYNVLTETSDAGAIYNGRDWTQRGTVIQYNYFHDLGLSVSGEGFHGVMGVYLDDCLPGTLVRGNVFENIDRGIMLGGGQYNIVDNNVFIDCKIAIHVDARGTGWATKYAVKGGGWNMYEKLASVDYLNAPWSTRYPELTTILDDPLSAIGVEVKRNISAGKLWLDMKEGTDFEATTVENNLTSDEVSLTWPPYEKGKNYGRGENGGLADILRSESNIVFEKPFVRIEGDELIYLQPDLLDRISFEPIPFNEIGLLHDKYRHD